MKAVSVCAVVVVLFAASSVFCEGNAAQPRKIVEIKEKMFIAQTNDVYLNSDDYMGKTIKLEGLFKREKSGVKEYFFVIRYGLGCCGYDGSAGFEVAWNSGGKKPYPSEDDWVEAVGTFGAYYENGYPFYYIALESLTVLSKRGAEYVTQ